MFNTAWQAIEDCNGHLYLAIINENDECVWFMSNYERIPGRLIEHINIVGSCVHTDPGCDSEDNPEIRYQKLISRDATGQWTIADENEIYWDNMHKIAEKEFKNNKHKIQWE